MDRLKTVNGVAIPVAIFGWFLVWLEHVGALQPMVQGLLDNIGSGVLIGASLWVLGFLAPIVAWVATSLAIFGLMWTGLSVLRARGRLW